MKKVLIASAAFLFAAISVNAQTTETAKTAQPPVQKQEIVETTQKTDQQTKTPVKTEALPEVVKKATTTEDYKGWVVSSAFIVKGKTEYYELVMAKDKETKTVKMDKEGKPVM